jgi:hypothetical protein
MEYEELLAKAEKESDAFSLVWQDQIIFSQSADDLQNKLLPYLIKEERASEWPGTKLTEIKATLRLYQTTSKSVNVLKKVGGVYNFLAPNYPEDLVFYKKSAPWFVSIAHEKDSWFIET